VLRAEKTIWRKLSSFLAMESDFLCASVSQAAKKGPRAGGEGLQDDEYSSL